MDIVQKISSEIINQKIPEFRPGDTVAVHSRIKEGDKERIQVFQGVVISRKRGAASSSFTVRKVSYGVGVERIFPLYSPMIERIEVVARGRVRRSRLYYLRDLAGKAARIKERGFEILADETSSADQSVAE
ncbi:MAG: 50S ribosomal protein L19 [Pseudomonadota bacterium]